MVWKLGVKENRTTVIYPGLTHGFIEKAKKTANKTLRQELGLDNKKVLFTLGRLVERKGVDNLIRALVYIKKKIPNVILIVAGDGPYRRKLEELADRK